MISIFQKIFFFLFIFVVLLTVPLFAQTHPIIPVNTNFYHWNHHWFLWTPAHPVYESIEVTTQDNPDNPNYKLVWAFFTERAGKKKQVHYFNDPQVAKSWRGEAYYREIEYKTNGRYGGALDLSVKFKDKDEKPVEWEALFDRNQDVKKAGLTDQSGHGSASFFLIFFREKAITTTNSKLTVGGEDFSFKKIPNDRAYSFQCAYSFNIYTTIISYDDVKTKYRHGTIINSTGRIFKSSEDKKSYQSNSFGYRNIIDLAIDGGQISSYKHIAQKNVFRIDFEPALPNFNSSIGAKKINYRISLDNFSNIITGVLVIKKNADAVSYDWRHQSPQWTKDYGFISTVK